MTATASQTLPLDVALKQAVTHHQAGRLQDAEQLYRAILQAEPYQPDANHNLGVLAGQVGQHIAGLPYLKTALTINPSHGQYALSYADALLTTGQAREALGILQDAMQRGLNTPSAHAMRQQIEAALNNPAKSEAPTPVEMDSLVALFNAGRYVELEIQTRLLVERYPSFGLAWKILGASLHFQGKNDLPILQKTTELLPDDAEAHFNLGNALQALGQLDGAVVSYRRALEIESDFDEAHFNLGNALQALGHLDRAVASYRHALEINPDYAEAHFNLGATLQALGQLDGAVVSYRQALEIKPDYAEALCNLGAALQALGQFDGAVASYHRALEIRPDYAEAHSNLGAALQAIGQLDGAVASYRRALEIKPNFAGALNNLASLLNDQGMSMMALDLANQSLRVEETWDAKSVFVSTVKGMHFSHADRDVLTNLVRALSEPWCRPNELVGVAADFVKLNSSIRNAVSTANLSWPRLLPAQALFEPAGLTAVAADPLLRALLESTPICDIDLERFLTLARRIMLGAASGGDTFDEDNDVRLEFFGALARQCFINEYVFYMDDNEAEQAKKLRDALVAALRAEAPIPAIWPVVVAAYFPLHFLPNAAGLLDRSWPDAVGAILVQQILEPEKERQNRATIPRLTPIEDDVSLLVQKQYEENPYPRWIMASPTDKPTTIDVSLRHRFPLAHFQSLDNVRLPDILIAGCGTGLHPIETAQQFRGAKILAIDLSLTSLCYAKRKTQELGLNSIEYVQADILKLGSIERRFDVIEACGVLHHLYDPWMGWRVLLSLLRPGGFMRLGFYSEVARRDVVSARSFIAEHGYGSSTEDIRQCRQDLMSVDESTGFRGLFKFSDMFSISECRDLIFHAQEHRMTLTGIEAFLRENGLQFIGFDISSRLLHAYRLRFPDDRAATNLNQWQVFENENPDTFIAMYQFWVQKSVNEDSSA